MVVSFLSDKKNLKLKETVMKTSNAIKNFLDYQQINSKKIL